MPCYNSVIERQLCCAQKKDFVLYVLSWSKIETFVTKMNIP